MIHFFKNTAEKFYLVQTQKPLNNKDIEKLNWLFGEAEKLDTTTLEGTYLGPRAAMLTPWSTNAVEITQNMGIKNIERIEEFTQVDDPKVLFDPMITELFNGLDQNTFSLSVNIEPIREIDDIAKYNEEEGLALNEEEIEYLESVSRKAGRLLTDSEVFAFSQANSEHCRHKIFNGTFIVDGKEKQLSLFKLIKKTTAENPNTVVSAYKDNVAFVKGPKVTQFAPLSADKPDFYTEKEFDSVISLKAETHNFPTTVEPFSGAATGAGGEIRDRLAGGQGALPLAGTAIYMTAYSRLAEDRPWEKGMKERKWLYQSPLDILIKASYGAADFGNKFGQPLITGSILTFEHEEGGRKLGYDKVIMQAGGIGYGKIDQALKITPEKGDQIAVLGGENYRIGMGGAAVSSANTGSFGAGIELNAIQRSNPEMQKRVANTIRGMVEADTNPVLSIHDHGAGGHLNCLSELVEETGGHIDIDKLPIGDPTLSYKEIIGNESQERMGLVIQKKNLEILKKVADRERSPMYLVGEVTDDNQFIFSSGTKGDKPLDYDLDDFFGSSPKTIMNDKSVERKYAPLSYSAEKIQDYLDQVLLLEAVASKDWIINKADRSVSGLVAKQQTVGSLQLPLNNVGVMALDYKGKNGVATSLGHSPLTALIDPKAGSRNAIAEALSNLVFAPLEKGLTSVSLSANWMWPCNNPGEDARLYGAVKACSDFAIALGINIPTGKDSLSMKQKYPNDEVIAPGTVTISAAAHCSDIRNVIEPVLQLDGGSIYYIHLSKDNFKLGGSSFAQILNKIGTEAPDIKDPAYFKTAFNAVQKLIKENTIAAGHDIGSGGLATTLLELSFAEDSLGAAYDFSALEEQDFVKVLFNENIALVLQAQSDDIFEAKAKELGLSYTKIGELVKGNEIYFKNFEKHFSISIPEKRKQWFKTSYLLDAEQNVPEKAAERFENFDKLPLQYKFPPHFDGKIQKFAKGTKRPKAAVLREKGSNSERELANALFLAGFDVKDVHMTDLVSGREDLTDIQFLLAAGGFSNSDVLGSAKGWAGSFLYNKKAHNALKNFFKREDTLSLGVCNGCQLFMELNLIHPELEKHGKMVHNDSLKFESGFVSVDIPKNNSVMLSSLEGSTLGIWAASGEGKFKLELDENQYNIIAKYSHTQYPANPNGSDYAVAMLSDHTGRHLVSMPHFERAIFPWNCAYYPKERKNDEVTPWLEGFANARKWIEKQNTN
ncbi:MAG TPA: phosphoribosylformylglycinamidine synthase [Sphingobacterium sp.]|nr:phosphoribosylformylglycinamidine synthase [Sphingobacterium sp.]